MKNLYRMGVDGMVREGGRERGREGRHVREGGREGREGGREVVREQTEYAENSVW